MCGMWGEKKRYELLGLIIILKLPEQCALEKKSIVRDLTYIQSENTGVQKM